MRPPVSVICPFAGQAPPRVTDALVLREGDEILLADNRRAPAPGGNVIDASGPASSYHARAVGAARASGEWLVFVDADTVPVPDLLDAYFDPLPDDDVGVLAGGIEDTVLEDTRVARYIADRRKLDQATTLAHPRRPYAQTANCAVRRTAFEAVGGWPEPIRSGGDADLCWRLAAAGWKLEQRPAALVRHRNRARLGELLRQLHRHGAGMRWLDERWPGSFPAPGPRELVAGRLAMLVRDPSAYGLLDVLGLWARDSGRLRRNR